ncbi:DUF3613 domain-containing protein [Stenotrophomonas hibiscicola]|uniref:DUF3613 domain-containing protein n=1 Tax=Stenotrophomonas hibiscicola TaxID=86189 RepID=UPI001660F109|nr:DUF3613 domain-containing protein [[Pseudomonas] hibiscicola]MBH1445318.1 DUF3613 domain-containing protein [Stenotrophomonas maltophilia]MBO0395237.1 DUF3613 domain-containing protein [Stenotrophomonas maltophilia]
MTATPLARRLLPALICLLPAAAVQAQQQPLTGQMLGGSTPAAPAAQPLQSESLPAVDLAARPVPVPQAAPAAVDITYGNGATARPGRSQIGDTARNLFRLQASGQQAGQHLPILGDQATLSYARYMKSFEHEIPDFFETDVAKSKGSSSSGR